MKRLYLDGKDISGMLKMNDEFVYVPFGIPFQAELLIQAGGGGGGGATIGGGGGGGAGGLITGSYTIEPGTSYSITVGAAGTGYQNSGGTNGGNSSAFGLVSIGGGKGGNPNSAASANGADGGSGGGATFVIGGTGEGGTGLQPSSASGGLGTNGGNSNSSSGGGGGGTATAGQVYDGVNLGSGGLPTGINFDTQGIVYFGTGGSGDASSNPANWGGPGSGGKGKPSGAGDNGRAGLVWIKYNSPFLLATGGDEVYRIGDWVYHKFTTVGTSTFKTV